MKTFTSRSRSKKNTIITAATLVALLIGYGAVAHKLSWWPFPDNSPTNTQKNKNSDQAEKIDDSVNLVDESAAAKQRFLDSQPKPSDDQGRAHTPSNDSIELSAELNSGSVIITTRLIDIPSGTCTITISNGEQQVSRSAEVMYAPEHSTCAGFSIPAGELRPGDWTIYLTVTSGDLNLKKHTSIKI